MIALILSALLACAAETRPPYGILLLAHGGDPSWNETVRAIKEGLKPGVPSEVALGMADPAEIQAAIGRLEEKAPGKIVAVPLFINSVSEVMEQTRYVLGLSEKPSETMRKMAVLYGPHAHMMFSTARVKAKEPLVLAPALDDDPAVAEILAARAKALSRDPSREVVVLVGHGPVDEEALRAWARTIKALADAVKQRGGYKSVVGATLRDDAPEPVRGKAVAALRELVAKAGLEGKVIVVPYLIAQGGIEKKVAQALKGLKYAWDGKTLCPHPAIGRWVSEQAAFAAKKEDMRRFR